MAFYDMLQNLSVIQLMFKDAADNNKFTGLTRGMFHLFIFSPVDIARLHVFMFG